jgi:hypothetical protein
MTTWQDKVRELAEIVGQLAMGVTSLHQYEAMIKERERGRRLCDEIAAECPPGRRTIEAISEGPPPDELVSDFITTIRQLLSTNAAYPLNEDDEPIGEINEAQTRRMLQVREWKTLADVDGATLARISAAAVELQQQQQYPDVSVDEIRQSIFNVMTSHQVRDQPPQVWDMNVPELISEMGRIVDELARQTEQERLDKIRAEATAAMQQPQFQREMVRNLQKLGMRLLLVKRDMEHIEPRALAAVAADELERIVQAAQKFHRQRHRANPHPLYSVADYRDFLVQYAAPGLSVDELIAELERSICKPKEGWAYCLVMSRGEQ